MHVLCVQWGRGTTRAVSWNCPSYFQRRKQAQETLTLSKSRSQWWSRTQTFLSVSEAPLGSCQHPPTWCPASCPMMPQTQLTRDWLLCTASSVLGL